MSSINDIIDPGYRHRAKMAIKEVEKIVDNYKWQYKKYKNVIDEINEAKVIALKTIKEAERFINSIANKSKDLEGVIVTPNLEQRNYEEDIKAESKKYKKGVTKTMLAGVLGIASIAFLPATVLSLPIAIFSSKNETKNNKQIIDECAKKIETINLEMARIQKSSSETVTEKEFLIIYSNNVKEQMLKLKETGITDYLKFSTEQKSDLGALVNAVKTLIKRIDSR